jgi:hypothetical protein
MSVRAPLLDSFVSHDKNDVLACQVFNRLRCYRQLISHDLELALLGDAGPRLVPRRFIGHNDVAALDLICTAASSYRLKQVDTFGVCGSRARGSFAIVAGKDKRNMSALRVYYMASGLLPVGVADCACRYLFNALAGVLPHTNELRGQILRCRWMTSGAEREPLLRCKCAS